MFVAVCMCNLCSFKFSAQTQKIQNLKLYQYIPPTTRTTHTHFISVLAAILVNKEEKANRGVNVCKFFVSKVEERATLLLTFPGAENGLLIDTGNCWSSLSFISL